MLFNIKFCEIKEIIFFFLKYLNLKLYAVDRPWEFQKGISIFGNGEEERESVPAAPRAFHQRATHWWYSKFLWCYFTDEGDKPCCEDLNLSFLKLSSHPGTLHVAWIKIFDAPCGGLLSFQHLGHSSLVQSQVNWCYKVIPELNFAGKFNFIFIL